MGVSAAANPRIASCTVPNHLNLDREELTYVGPGRTALTSSTAREAGAKAMFLFASEGLVGAYVLAGELATTGGEHRRGYAAYETQLRPFAERNQSLGKERMMAKVIEPIHKAATAITLKDHTPDGE